MKFICYGILLFAVSCKIEEQTTPSVTSNKPQKVVLAKQEAFLEKGFSKIKAALQIFSGPSPFCKALLESSPTREEYVQNWQPQSDVTLCPESAPLLESCQKKNDDAFREGLLCYQVDFFAGN